MTVDPGREAGQVLVIHAANVIGSRPTGWWRDRPGAARRFTEQVRATVAAGRLDPPVTIVLEGKAKAGAAEGTADGVDVLHAPGEGDDTIAAIAQKQPEWWSSRRTEDWPTESEQRTGEVVGPSWLLDRLEG